MTQPDYAAIARELDLLRKRVKELERENAELLALNKLARTLNHNRKVELDQLRAERDELRVLCGRAAAELDRDGTPPFSLLAALTDAAKAALAESQKKSQ